MRFDRTQIFQEATSLGHAETRTAPRGFQIALAEPLGSPSAVGIEYYGRSLNRRRERSGRIQNINRKIRSIVRGY